jgi:hypothetical protein
MAEKRCGKPAKFRYTWPGNNEAVVCEDCALKVKTVANTLGFYLQMIELSEADQQVGFTCTQFIGE